jgi:hypothetical protein
MEMLFLDTGQAIPFPSERFDAMLWIEDLNDIPAIGPDEFPVFRVLITRNVLNLVIADPS